MASWATNKIFDFLMILKKELAKNRHRSLAGLARKQHIPGEYIKYAIEDGLIVRIFGGKRGPSIYRFNKNKVPTAEIAMKYQLRYNKERLAAKIRRSAKQMNNK